MGGVQGQAERSAPNLRPHLKLRPCEASAGEGAPQRAKASGGEAQGLHTLSTQRLTSRPRSSSLAARSNGSEELIESRV